MASGDELVGGAGDGFADLARDHAGLHVGLGGGLLDLGEARNQRRVYAQEADPEVVERPFGLNAVKRVGGHARFAQWIAFDAELLFGSVHIRCSLARLASSRLVIIRVYACTGRVRINSIRALVQFTCLRGRKIPAPPAR